MVGVISVGRPKKVADEWYVPVYIDGKFCKDKTYYTNDKHDAFDTYKLMLKENSSSADVKLVDMMNVGTVEVQISSDGDKLWVNVGSNCALRIKGISAIHLCDSRPRLIVKRFDNNKIKWGIWDNRAEDWVRHLTQQPVEYFDINIARRDVSSHRLKHLLQG